MILEAIDCRDRRFEFISKTLRNPQNAAREILAADFCTVSNFFFEVAYSSVDLVQRECARYRPAPTRAARVLPRVSGKKRAAKLSIKAGILVVVRRASGRSNVKGPF
ncbi:hypothetical protein [Bradyrhizobium sp. DASA03120]|uniref:hypothetical protein n=1 Tax=Bradyrhizobium sp. SMVTL-02 TaxID=3395917 RepID=UPI003F6EA2FC